MRFGMDCPGMRRQGVSTVTAHLVDGPGRADNSGRRPRVVAGRAAGRHGPQEYACRLEALFGDAFALDVDAARLRAACWFAYRFPIDAWRRYDAQRGGRGRRAGGAPANASNVAARARAWTSLPSLATAVQPSKPSPRIGRTWCSSTCRCRSSMGSKSCGRSAPRWCRQSYSSRRSISMPACLRGARHRLPAEAIHAREVAPVGRAGSPPDGCRGPRDRRSIRRLAALLDEVQERGRYLQRVPVRAGARIVLLDTSEVDWIQAADNYVLFHSAGREYLMRETLVSARAGARPASVRPHPSFCARASRPDRRDAAVGPRRLSSHVEERRPSSTLSRHYRERVERILRRPL